MSDDSEDNPFHSEPDYYPIYPPEIMGNDDEHWQEESTETWQPEIVQIMNDHGFSPEDLKIEGKGRANWPSRTRSFMHYCCATRIGPLADSIDKMRGTSELATTLEQASTKGCG